MVLSPHFRGYARPSWERTRGPLDWREQIDMGAERLALPTGSRRSAQHGCEVPTDGRRH